MQKISPFLWFDNQAEEAVNHYASIFSDLQIISTMRFGDGSPGTVNTIGFRLFGQDFTAINGGPGFASFTPAISFVVKCETQQEVDQYWDNLLNGGKAMQCGWLTDKFGITWQIVPTMMLQLMSDKNAAKAKKVTEAMMKMVKLDIPTLQKAYDEA